MRAPRIATAALLLVGAILLAANLIPRVGFEVPGVTSPEYQASMLQVGVREFGWPATARKDDITDEIFAEPLYTMQYSPNHLFLPNHVRVGATTFSPRAILVDVAFLVAALMLTATFIRAASEQRFALRTLLIAFTAISVMAAALAYEDMLATTWWLEE